ncbi:helix-turn-helix domain-containing protein [Massilia pinisoli]|uniref:Helix-turn-helix domain-containing protein n=1 Tax=Massilia pinisoli TaxID=1772194 RepID=A0ABT1ZTX5_9BURK|nr:helix-turn-helix domain-containing protein [Massilia pinisoli]MCS0583334.1 helix-turn-helix domain-containing protein [Massilia pinisoli]
MPSRLRLVALLAFEGVQVLDVTGPAAVFGAANDAAVHLTGRPFYRLHILSPQGGHVTSNCGLALVTAPVANVRPGALDTVLVAGGSKRGLQALAQDAATQEWLRRACARARRYGSVCTGAFALAACGLLDGKRVATHWEATDILGRTYPDVEVDANALYVEDGRAWTSAGVTTGIDMCLALVARDLGDAVANAIARRLVLYARRPGYQSQFSTVLAAQEKADAPFAGLVDWIRTHLDDALDVASLAARAGMSPRTFHRRFTDALGETPARFVDTLRLDHARRLLQTTVALKTVAAQSGYATPAQLSKAFARRFGMSPGLFRAMHREGPQAQ